MKKTTKTCIAVIAVTIGTFLTVDFSSSAHSNDTGAPSGRTGSPGDGMNCTNGCHVGASNPFTNPGMISTNIPAGGYTPGATYTITATSVSPGPTTPLRYGFEISPQNAAGAQRGTLVVTNSSETQLIGGTKYITHTFAGSAPSAGAKTWTFDWIAPAAGSGTVTFYGAFVFGNGNNSNIGDLVALSTLPISEAVVGINEVSYAADNWSVYPNPVTDKLQITNSLLKEGKFDITIFDVTGKKVKEIKAYDLYQKNAIDIAELNNGIYILNIATEKGVINKKIIKK